MDQDLLIRNGFIAVPAVAAPVEWSPERVRTSVATVISNLATYGYIVDAQTLKLLFAADDLTRWWGKVEPVLKSITGADRNMGEFIVYKNFPREVLDMDHATQVWHQVLIYQGMPQEFLVEAENVRPVLGDTKRLKVLTASNDQTGAKIFADLMSMGNRWTDNQKVWAEKLIGQRNAIVFSDFGFKENAVHLAAKFFAGIEFEPSSATDVIRVAAGVSGGDVSLRETVRFRRMQRPERRRLLAALDGQTGLEADFAMRPGPWKRLLHALRPGDYKHKDGTFVFPNVVRAYDDLFQAKTKPFGALADPQMPTPDTLKTVATRPGEFLRRFHHYYGLFGRGAVDAFLPVMERLNTRQLVGLRAYMRSINGRVFMIYPPKSNWARAQVQPNSKTAFSPADRKAVEDRISEILGSRLAKAFPEGVALDMRVDAVKLQTNDQKLAEYGRGTEFDIPENIHFIRSASYWAKTGRHGYTWYDNGWNFFDENWQPLGTCGWDAQTFPYDRSYWRGRKDGKQISAAAIFSGDPVNTRDLKGRACQMADLYLDRLEGLGVRFCVWNVLCYSRIKFSDADDVLATLQMGENPEEGQTYEPSRAQMVFPLKSEAYTSYPAYLDLKRRKIVYMDVGFPGSTSSAQSNSENLKKLMPAYVEYLDALPSVLELMQDAPTGTTPIRYDDRDTEITGGRAFVFRPERSENRYDRLSVTDLVAKI